MSDLIEKAELEALYMEQRAAWVAAQKELRNGALSDDRVSHYERLARDIEARKIRAIATSAMVSHLGTGDVGILRQLVSALQARCDGLEARIRDLERHAVQSGKLEAYKESESPVTTRSTVAALAGAADSYYNGKPRQ